MWENIDGVETRKFIKGRWVASKKEFAEFAGVGLRTIERYLKDGMPIHTASADKFIIIDVEECLEWKSANTSRSKANNIKKGREVEIEIPKNEEDEIKKQINDIQGKIKQAHEKLQLDGTSEDEASRIKKILEGLETAIKLGERSKDLIPKKDTEKAIIEMVAILVAGYKKDIKTLPKECADRDEIQIREILENNYKANMEKFQKLAKSNLVSDAKLYSIIEVVIGMILNGISIDSILEKIK